jgi:hypothetical protein
MGFFTVFTLYIAIFNPVNDCGCFGEAMKLTNWETFYKNLILDIFVVIVFLQRNNYRPLSTCRNEIITGGAFALFSVLLSIYCLRHLPLIDFLPYKVDVNILQDMEIPEDAPVSIYETTLIYEKEGEGRRSFSLQDYPKDDPSWHFVEARHVLKQKGYEPPIADFGINSREREDITDYILNLPGYLFIVTLPHVDKASLSHIHKINAINDYVLAHDSMHFIGLSGSDDQLVEQFVERTNARYPIYITDEKPLKSMVRANPGLMLLYNGTIVAKWSHIDVPSIKKIENKYLSENPELLIARHRTGEWLATSLLAVVFFVLMIMLSYCFRKYGPKEETDADSSMLSA